MMVLDTDVFIDHFRGQEAATTYIHNLSVDQRATSDITVMELYKGAANQQELATILQFLMHNRVTRLPVSTTASQRAVELVHQYGLAHGLGIPDALIAAITLEGAHTLVTDNVRHFRFIPGLHVLRAPKAEATVYPWREPKDLYVKTVQQVREFLRKHRPTMA